MTAMSKRRRGSNNKMALIIIVIIIIIIIMKATVNHYDYITVNEGTVVKIKWQ